MEQELALIESFFNNELNAKERQEFEKRCEIDLVFAETVALYVKTKYGFIKMQQNQRKVEFEKIRQQHISTRRRPATTKTAYWVAAVAAICLAVFSWLYFAKQDLTKLADIYVKENFMTLSTTMSADKETFKEAIALFNQGELEKAGTIFDSLAEYNNPEALKYAGIAYLRLQKYALALEHFDVLQNQNLQSNPGAFYKAITLLKRNQGNDLIEAQKILEKVKEEKTEGWQEIEKWNF